MGKYYIYRFLDKDKNVLYVGKTKNIEQRMTSHLSPNAIENEKWKENIDVTEFTYFKNPYEMSIGEIYLIGKYKPKFNKEFMEDYPLTIEIDKYEDIKWIKYKDIRLDYIDEYDFFKNLPIENRIKVKSLIMVCQGKVNNNYFKKNNREVVLSDYWISRHPEAIIQLRKNVTNIVKNKLNLKSSEVACIVPYEHINNIKNKGFSKSIYPPWENPDTIKDRKFIAYIYNGYPTNSRAFEKTDDLHKVVNLLQFIWRSRIREGKPIDLYIPSRRMRDLLYDYLEGRI